MPDCAVGALRKERRTVSKPQRAAAQAWLTYRPPANLALLNENVLGVRVKREETRGFCVDSDMVCCSCCMGLKLQGLHNYNL